jgi:hypothetical protein
MIHLNLPSIRYTSLFQNEHSHHSSANTSAMLSTLGFRDQSSLNTTPTLHHHCRGLLSTRYLTPTSGGGHGTHPDYLSYPPILPTFLILIPGRIALPTLTNLPPALPNQ